jgi:ABC-type phosphate transport system substrate-binding protein
VTGRKTFVASVLLFCAAARGAFGAPDYVLIVNAHNPVTILPRHVVSDFFLKKATSWSDGARTKPVDLSDSSAIRESFSHAVHRKASREIYEIWQRQIYSGRDVPPPQKASELEVVDYVSRNVGAIGYVAVNTPLPPGVKVLRIQQER